MAKKSLPYEIERPGRTWITVPHQGSSLRFAYPPFEVAPYIEQKRAIENEGLSTPTMAETVSLLFAAYSFDEPEFRKLRALTSGSRIRGFTATLSVPGKGVYVQDHPDVENNRIVMDESSLEARLGKHDPSVRFVPFGFALEEQSSQEFKGNAFARALIGEEGVEKVAEFSSRNGLTLYLSLDSDPSRPAISYAGFYASSGRAYLGCYWDPEGSDPALGVQKMPAKQARKK